MGMGMAKTDAFFCYFWCPRVIRKIRLSPFPLYVVEVTSSDFAVEVVAVGAVEAGAEVFGDVRPHFRAHALNYGT